MTVRPRRSVLYMPGANTRALEKARTLPADALIFDLEDAVAPDAKEAARDNVVRGGRRAGPTASARSSIRCNGLATPWGKADVAAIATSGADAILVPKVESAADVARGRGAARCRRRAGDDGGVGDDGNAAGHPARRGDRRRAPQRLRLFVMGTNDLVKDMRARHTPMRLPMIDRARPRHAGGARLWPRRSSTASTTTSRTPTASARLPAGARDGLRRQDADPSRARSSRATRSSRRRRAERRDGAARSSPPSRQRRPRARASSRSTAAWSRTCMSSMAAARPGAAAAIKELQAAHERARPDRQLLRGFPRRSGDPPRHAAHAHRGRRGAVHGPLRLALRGQFVRRVCPRARLCRARRSTICWSFTSCSARPCPTSR